MPHLKVQADADEQTASINYKVDQLSKRQRQKYQAKRWQITKVMDFI